MPSQALLEYRLNLRDVRRLVAAHDAGNARAPGKRALGHFTKGGLLLLCAAWERYVESVLEEAATFYASRLATSSQLPPNALKLARDRANDNSTTWTAGQLSAPGWQAIYEDALRLRTAALNTPKSGPLKTLFDTVLGIPDIAQAWSGGTLPIDAFISTRGDVAHRGGQSAYVHIGALRKAIRMVDTYVSETDNYLSDQIRIRVTPNRRPWNRKK